MGDTPIPGIEIKITSQPAQPGQTFTQTTDGSGSYNISLSARTADYKVEITGLPGGFTIVIPATMFYSIHVVRGNSQTDHADNVDFLLQGCGHPTTTTSTTSTTKKEHHDGDDHHHHIERHGVRRRGAG